jgi:hypothetical protein
MPFPGPAKEQRMTHDIIQMGNAEKKEKIREQANETFLRETIVRTKHCARDIRIWIKKKPERREKKNRPLPAGETTWTDKEGAEGETLPFSFPPNASKGAFYSKFSARSLFLLSLALEQGMDGESMRVLHARKREGERNGWMAMLGSLCTILLGVHFDALVLPVLWFVFLQ